MAGAVAERRWRESAPETIERDLAALWRELGEGNVPVARAVMSNLIVCRGQAPAGSGIEALVAGLPLDEVAARHPSRMIVLSHCDEAAPGTRFAAGVAILTFGSEQARYGVEQIVVRSACPEGALLSILRRFVRGDLPTSVWWTEDLSDGAPFDPLLTVGRQIVYDSRRWRDVRRAAAVLAPLVASERVDLADLNWRRLTPLRRALVHAVAPIASDAWTRTPIRVAHAPDEGALAWLCAGWVRSGRGADARAVAVEPDARDAVLVVSIGAVTATLTHRTVEILSPTAPPLVVSVPQEHAADAIAAELRELAPDAALLAALRTLARD